ncbi:DNA double-strand break repair nuclease NurA [Halorussus salilacus]|uniref:DNA double-strand break repair nuclease NurA n=1 Tax=Halorussus salilacus TaxID=2953750 RepID=UPI00209F2358|nr:DNA double-strand break repair nuclease NurA [Halorussus salilacus]USZ67637.1 DNA double-strand break repair nuclease NurA [Halorussus salilacus]
MTLDPVHFDGIAGLADRIDYDAEDRDHREFAEDVWEHYLDPLYDDEGDVILEPIDEQSRRRVNCEKIALEDPPFATIHGLDAGTLNSRPFKNGLVLDVAHAAMSATPSDLGLHDRRTVVKALHLNDTSRDFGTDWEPYNDGSRRRIVHTHLPKSQYEEDVVHALALYLAESSHALEHAESVSEFLLLDGPIYPKGVLRWYYRSTALTDLFRDSEDVARILQNYVELVETFVERDVPLAGFVKNVSAKSIVRTLKRSSDFAPVPWAHDAGLFAQILERRERVDGEFERLTDDLTLTNWFVSTAGTDDFFNDPDNDLVERELDPEQYRVTFCIVYDPRRDLVFKVEAPYAVTEDEGTRRKIERQILQEVALQRGPPRAISKADELAAIDRGSAESLVKSFEESLDTELDRNYNAVRWGRDY